MKKLFAWLSLWILFVQVSPCFFFLCKKNHGKIKESIVLKNEAIDDGDLPVMVSKFQEIRWYQCWVFRKEKKFSAGITMVILSYLSFAPRTTTLCSHGGLYRGVLSRDGRWFFGLVRWHTNDRIIVSDLSTWEPVKTLSAQGEYLYSLAVADNLSFVVAGGACGQIFIWNTNSTELVINCTGQNDKHGVRCLRIFFNETRFVSSGESPENILRIWKVKRNTCICLHVLRGHEGQIRAIDVSSDNRLIASISEDETIRAWDTDTGTCLRVVAFTGFPYWDSCLFAVNNSNVVGSVTSGETNLWNMSTGECTKNIGNITTFDRSIGMVDLSIDRLVWWTYRYVGVYDLINNKNINTIEIPRDSHTDKASDMTVNISADGKHIIMVLDYYYTGEAVLYVYDIETGKLIE